MATSSYPLNPTSLQDCPFELVKHCFEQNGQKTDPECEILMKEYLICTKKVRQTWKENSDPEKDWKAYRPGQKPVIQDENSEECLTCKNL